MSKPSKWLKEDDDKLREVCTKILRGEAKFNGWDKMGINRPAREVHNRWRNYLDPSINWSKFTEEEEAKIWSLFMEVGNRWVDIANMLGTHRT